MILRSFENDVGAEAFLLTEDDEVIEKTGPDLSWNRPKCISSATAMK